MSEKQETTEQRLTLIVEELASEPASYFCDEYVLEVDYIVSMSRYLKGVIVCTGTGGPHLELNTQEREVVGYWGGKRVARYYSESDKVQEFWEEYAEGSDFLNLN